MLFCATLLSEPQILMRFPSKWMSPMLPRLRTLSCGNLYVGTATWCTGWSLFFAQGLHAGYWMNANGRHVFFGTNHFWVEKVRKSETNDANFRMSDLYLAGRRLLVQGCLCNNQQSRNATRRMPVVWKLSFFEQDHLCIPGNTGWFKENAWSEGFSNKQPLISAIRFKSRHQKILKPINRHSEYKKIAWKVAMGHLDRSSWMFQHGADWGHDAFRKVSDLSYCCTPKCTFKARTAAIQSGMTLNQPVCFYEIPFRSV